MGVKLLNRFIIANCPEAIRQLKFSELKNMKIAVDTSIYMYRYSVENALIDKMYQMIMVFKHFNIIPVFVFDGKPPTEKKELLQIRRDEKIIAENRYYNLKQHLMTIKNVDEIKEIQNEMDSLRKKFVRLTFTDIENVKKLMDLCGVTYYQAEGEADKLCAKLVLDNKVYACLSEDSDLFVYGCPRVLKYISLLNYNVVLYDLKYILNILNLTLNEFKQICILSGTDYNYNRDSNITIYNIIKLFEKYKTTDAYSTNDFYKWYCDENNNIYNSIDNEKVNNYNLLKTSDNMFDISSMDISKFLELPILNISTQKEKLHEFLDKFNFIFI